MHLVDRKTKKIAVKNTLILNIEVFGGSIE